MRKAVRGSPPEPATASPATGAPMSVEQALGTILSRVRPLGLESVALEDSLGRTLGREVVSTISLPPWDNAGMDGYAVIREDIVGCSVGQPAALRVVATIQAGSALRPEIVRGTCARIMTGAPVPPGTTAVVRVEDTDRGTETVSIVSDRDARSPTGNVRARGGDVTTGSLVARAGDHISPALLGVLASVGCTTVDVVCRPQIVLASSGNELVTVEGFSEVQSGRAIVSSSSYALPALLRAAGADVRVLPLLPDDEELMRDAIGRALEGPCDLLVTTGGVSVGAFDHMRSIIRGLGGRIDVHRVRVRPGGPLGAGHVLGTPWIGLPGNPVSTLVTAELFVCPAVRTLAGLRTTVRGRLPVRLAQPVAAPAPLRYYLRATLQPAADGVLEAALTGAQGSNLLTSMARAQALLEIDGPEAELAAGTMVPALLLDGALLSEPTPSTHNTSAREPALSS